MPPEQLPARLEQTLGLGRNSWPVSAIRALADRMLELTEGRSKSAAHELRWLNLCGFCLRPGFGFPGDDFRIEQARRVYASGLQFSNQIQNEIEWWIFWGRVAGGLNKNQQTDLFQRLSPILLPRGSKRPRVNSSLLREMWRAAASLELLPIQTKTQLGDELITRVLAGEFVDTGLWCIARLGARKLFYGPINQVLPPAVAARWVEQLLKVAESQRCDWRSRTPHGRRHARSAGVHSERGSPDIPRSRTGSRAAGSSRRHGPDLRRGFAVGSRIS